VSFLHNALAAGALFTAASAVAPAQSFEIERVVSPGGVEAWLIEDHTNPIIALSFAFRGGAALDPAGKEGLANLVSGLLDEGAGEIPSQAFQAKLADLSIRLSFDAGFDSFNGTVQTLTENRDTAFELLALALSQPRFDEEPVERIRGQILTMLRRDSENPNDIARRTLFRTLFPDHPYGRPADGTEETVARIKIADLKLFAATRFARDNLVVSAVGNITPGDLAALLDKTFATLPAAAAPWTAAEVVPAAGAATIVVEKNVPQSAILFAQPGIKRDDPDFFPAYVMNYILGGGGFGSRLYEQVREKRGLAYSAYSYLYPLDHAGLIVGGAGTRNDQAGRTLGVIAAELRRMAADGVGEKELDDAKTFLTGSFPLRFSSSGRVAAMMTGIQLEELGIDYWDRRNGLVAAVTLEQVNEQARRLLDPARMTTVVVGRPEGIDATRTIAN
jgi:zinc protease